MKYKSCDVYGHSSSRARKKNKIKIKHFQSIFQKKNELKDIRYRKTNKEGMVVIVVIFHFINIVRINREILLFFYFVHIGIPSCGLSIKI